MKKFYRLLLVTVLMMFVLSITANAASISMKSATLNKGQTLQLSVNDAEGSVKWTSSKKSVATVNQNGLVVAKKKGTCKITAKIGKKKYTCKLTVKQLVTGFWILAPTSRVNVGKTLKLSPKVYPSNANNKNLTWRSLNPFVATVSSKGVVTGVANGRTYVCGTSCDGSNVSRRFEIVVEGGQKPQLNTMTVNITPDNFLQYFEPIVKQTYDRWGDPNGYNIYFQNKLIDQGWYMYDSSNDFLIEAACSYVWHSEFSDDTYEHTYTTEYYRHYGIYPLSFVDDDVQFKSITRARGSITFVNASHVLDTKVNRYEGYDDYEFKLCDDSYAYDRVYKK